LDIFKRGVTRYSLFILSSISGLTIVITK
jgi:hypothetical protein